MGHSVTLDDLTRNVYPEQKVAGVRQALILNSLIAHYKGIKENKIIVADKVDQPALTEK